MLYASNFNFDNICMYLSLRCNNVDLEGEDGENIFTKYLHKKDIERMGKLLKRGCDPNYVSTKFGYTPLHHAIEAKMASKFVKFLLKNGANPHIEDFQGIDCCDKAIKVERYRDIKIF